MWDRPDFICINGQMVLFLVDGFVDYDDYRIEPDFVIERCSGISVVGYHQSLAMLVATMAANVRPDTDVVLDLTAYLKPRATHSKHRQTLRNG